MVGSRKEQVLWAGWCRSGALWRDAVSKSSGFTLIEVVVALALASLVALGLTTALKTVGDAGDRLDKIAFRSEDARVVVAFLRQIVQSASARQGPSVNGLPAKAYFQGGEGSLEWLGVMPARYGAGGLYHFRLELLFEDGGEGSLILRYMPFVPRPELPDWSLGKVHLLAKGVDSMSLAYQGRDELEWGPSWLLQDVVPGKLAFKLSAKKTGWPEIVVPIYAAERRVLIEPKKPENGR